MEMRFTWKPSNTPTIMRRAGRQRQSSQATAFAGERTLDVPQVSDWWTSRSPDFSSSSTTEKGDDHLDAGAAFGDDPPERELAVHLQTRAKDINLGAKGEAVARDDRSRLGRGLSLLRASSVILRSPSRSVY